MRFFVLTLLFLTALNAAETRFAGRWVATFKGHTICTFEIDEPAGKVAGASKSCRVSVDLNGDLVDAGVPDEDQQPQPFLNPSVDGTTLKYELPDDDGGERMKFEFQLIADGKADLRFVGAPIDIKPIRFERR